MQERQEIRRILWQWGRAQVQMDELADQMRRAAERMRGLYEDAVGGGLEITGMPRSTVTGDPVFRAMEKIGKMRELFAEEIETCEARARELARFRENMDELVDSLRAEARDVLRCRYLGGHSWTYVGIRLHMDEATARRIERDACDRLGKMIVVEKR